MVYDEHCDKFTSIILHIQYTCRFKNELQRDYVFKVINSF